MALQGCYLQFSFALLPRRRNAEIRHVFSSSFLFKIPESLFSNAVTQNSEGLRNAFSSWLDKQKLDSIMAFPPI
jgi:hypothetical protein